MAPAYDSALDEIAIFRNIGAADRAAIAGTCRWQRVKANEQVVGHQDATTDIFFVVQGNLRVAITSISGKAVTYHDVGPGEVFGEFAAIDGTARSADVVALNDAFIGALAANDFRRVLESHPAVAAALLKRLVGIIRELNERVFEFSTLTVNNRIHAELLRQAYACGVAGNAARIAPAPTHAEIAARVSTTREAVTRELNALARSGMLTKEKQALVINDVAKFHDALTREGGALLLGERPAR